MYLHASAATGGFRICVRGARAGHCLVEFRDGTLGTHAKPNSQK